MIRRSFLLTPLATLVFGCKTTQSNSEPKVRSEFGLGTYKRHYVEFNNVIKHNNSDYGLTFVNFPVEDVIVIEYDKGCETYTGFNLHKDRVKMINTCSIQELLKFRINTNQKMEANFTAVFEFKNISENGEKFSNKFWLSSIVMYSDEKVPKIEHIQ